MSENKRVGRKTNESRINKDEFVKLYTSGMDILEIAKKLDVYSRYINVYLYGHFFAPDRIQLKKERLMNIELKKRGEVA